jgi:hypothetical protein
MDAEMEKIKVLNLYAGMGGNRKLWENVDVTSVEYNPEIAAIYSEYFPQDTVIVGDANEYYDPLIKPTIELDRHLFWANFKIKPFRLDDRVSPWAVTSSTQAYGFDVSTRKIKHRKDQLIRNLVNPELGLHILNCAIGKEMTYKQTPLFK